MRLDDMTTEQYRVAEPHGFPFTFYFRNTSSSYSNLIRVQRSGNVSPKEIKFSRVISPKYRRYHTHSANRLLGTNRLYSLVTGSWRAKMELLGSVGLLFLLFLGFALLVVAWKTIKIVPQSSVLLIERLGRFHRVAASGLNIIVPFFESPRAVYWTNTRPGTTFIDSREQFIDLPPQSVISRDNVMMGVDSVVYWQITDPVKATYEVNDLVGSIVQLTFTGMRSVIGKLDLDHTLSSRDQINNELRLILDEATDKWGVKVTRVDIKNITPPEDVRITMEKQMTAERNRRALIFTAEGDKQAAITRAEGEKPRLLHVPRVNVNLPSFRLTEPLRHD